MEQEGQKDNRGQKNYDDKRKYKKINSKREAMLRSGDVPSDNVPRKFNQKKMIPKCICPFCKEEIRPSDLTKHMKKEHSTRSFSSTFN